MLVIIALVVFVISSKKRNAEISSSEGTSARQLFVNPVFDRSAKPAMISNGYLDVSHDTSSSEGGLSAEDLHIDVQKPGHYGTPC